MNFALGAARRAWKEKALWIPVALAFLFVSLSRIDDGGTNARARFATLRAMSDYHTFVIDEFVDWTMDWTQTPDGHYYSNKAPGPTLIAYPLFWAIDQAMWERQNLWRDNKGRRQEPRGIHKVAISAVYQLFPFLVFSLLALAFAAPSASSLGYLFGGLAILFGNTSAVLMISYMGNPFAAMAMMGLVVAYFRRSLDWASFAFGWMVLADYPAAPLALPFAWLFWPEARARGIAASARSIALGAALPAALWVWYHTVCFGSPFALPFHFKVAAIEGTVAGGALGGKTSLLPHGAWLFELLMGTRRGLLFTQPWLLVCAVLPLFFPIRDSRVRRLYWFSLASLAILLFENAGFPGWHGGGAPGPRYLGAALPIFGLFLPALFDAAARPVKVILGFTVLVSFVFRALVYSTWILAPSTEPIWPYYLGAIKGPTEWAYLGKFAWIFLCTGALYVHFARSRRKNPSGSPSPAPGESS